MKILSKEEATHVDRPDTLTGHGYEPWNWPDPAHVAVSDCHRVLGVVGARSAEDGDSPLSLALAVNFFETLYAHGYAIVKLEEGEMETALQIQAALGDMLATDTRPWFVTVTAVRETSVLNHKPSFIPAIKALRLVGINANGWHLSLAEAKDTCDRLRNGTQFVFPVAGEIEALSARATLESAGMTVVLSRDEAMATNPPRPVGLPDLSNEQRA